MAIDKNGDDGAEFLVGMARPLALDEKKGRIDCTVMLHCSLLPLLCFGCTPIAHLLNILIINKKCLFSAAR